MEVFGLFPFRFEDSNNKGYPLQPVVREYHPPYEEIDFEVICGVVVMDLNINLIEILHEEQPSETVIRFLTPLAASFEVVMRFISLTCLGENETSSCDLEYFARFFAGQNSGFLGWHSPE